MVTSRPLAHISPPNSIKCVCQFRIYDMYWLDMLHAIGMRVFPMCCSKKSSGPYGCSVCRSSMVSMHCDHRVFQWSMRKFGGLKKARRMHACLVSNVENIQSCDQGTSMKFLVMSPVEPNVAVKVFACSSLANETLISTWESPSDPNGVITGCSDNMPLDNNGCSKTCLLTTVIRRPKL